MSVLLEKADLSLKYIAHYNDVKEQLFLSSPDVLNAPRAKAFMEFVKQGIPTRKSENYKYTNLHPQFSTEFEFVHQKQEAEVDLNEVFRCDVPQLNTHLTLMYNGWYYERNLGSRNLPNGVILDSLENVARNNPELVQNYYSKIAKPGEDPLVALNTALAMDGYFLYIPKNVSIDKPIQLINLLQTDANTFVSQRNIIVVEPGANVQIVVCDHTLNLKKYLSNSVTEVFVGENANFEYYTLQNQHNNTTSLNSIFIQQESGSKAATHTMSLHGGLIRNNLEFFLNGENAEAHMYGMAFLDRKQHVDNFTKVIHGKPNCESNQIYKNVLDDQSTGAFSGQIHVLRDAQKTNAFQRNNNLLLTDEAAIYTKPQLIIDADDVKCSHGATVGQIDQEAMFYLRSRGIDKDKALLMMMNAFAYEVVEQIKIEAFRNRIEELIVRRLQGEVALCHDCAYNCES